MCHHLWTVNKTTNMTIESEWIVSGRRVYRGAKRSRGSDDETKPWTKTQCPMTVLETLHCDWQNKLNSSPFYATGEIHFIIGGWNNTTSLTDQIQLRPRFDSMGTVEIMPHKRELSIFNHLVPAKHCCIFYQVSLQITQLVEKEDSVSHIFMTIHSIMEISISWIYCRQLYMNIHADVCLNKLNRGHEYLKTSSILYWALNCPVLLELEALT